MSTNRNNTLKLRNQSIRTLTPTELRAAHGGSPHRRPHVGWRGAGHTQV